MFTRLVTKLLLISSILLICNFRLAAQLNYSFERINTENGLPTNALKGIVFDDINRFLWVATESGLLRYNGHGFQTFGDSKKKSKLNSRIVHLLKKNDHSIFATVEDFNVFNINKNKVDFGIEKKIIKWSEQLFSYIYSDELKLKKPSSTSITFPLLKVRDRYFQIVDKQLVSFTDNKKIVLIDKVANNKIFSLNEKLYIINNKLEIKRVDFTSTDSIHVFLMPISISIDNFNKYALNKFNVFQDLPNEPVHVFVNNCIYELKLKAKKIFFEKKVTNIPSDDFIKFLQFDKLTNTAYLGTDNRGLIIAHPQYFSRKQPLNVSVSNSATTYAQVKLPNGNIQVNTGEIYGSDSISNIKFFDIVSEPRTFITKDGFLLYTNYLGVTKFNIKTKRKKIVSADIFYNKSAFFEFGDSVYLFSNFGVGILNKSDSINKIITYNNVSETYFVYDVARYDANRLLIATSEGLYFFNLKSNTFKLFYKDPLGKHFRTIYRHQNYFFIGSYGGGIYVLSNNVIKPLSLDKNSYLKFSHCFVPLGNDVWISTNKGIFKSTFSNLISNYNNSDVIPNYTYYGKQEGIDILEMNGGCTPCAIKMSNGVISVPGIDGLIQFNPSLLPKVIINPHIYIDKYKFNDTLVEGSNFFAHTISHKVDIIQLLLGVSGMVSEENIELEYDLDGKGNWREISVKSPILTIENPRSGSHLLNIRWKNTNALSWSNELIAFEVAYPWYSHPYMFFGYFIFVFLLILGYVKIKTFFYKRRQLELENEVSVKTKNLQEINKYLSERIQAKDQVIAIMNHDILTPLKYLHITASNLAVNLHGTESSKPIAQIKATTKELEYLTSNLLSWVKFDTINQLDQKQSINLRDLFDSIIEFISPFKQSDNVFIINDIPSDLILHSWYDPMRVLFYNLLMNSLKSTLNGHIIISSKIFNDKISISVTDQGLGMSHELVEYLLTGIKTDTQFISTKYKKGNGVGYQIIRNLVKLIFADMQISSTIGGGTKVEIIISRQ